MLGFSQNADPSHHRGHAPLFNPFSVQPVRFEDLQRISMALLAQEILTGGLRQGEPIRVKPSMLAKDVHKDYGTEVAAGVRAYVRRACL